MRCVSAFTTRTEAGESIGYGARFTAPHDMLVGVASIGYGDGYPRSMADGAPALVDGQTCSMCGLPR